LPSPTLVRSAIGGGGRQALYLDDFPSGRERRAGSPLRFAPSAFCVAVALVLLPLQPFSALGLAQLLVRSWSRVVVVRRLARAPRTTRALACLTSASIWSSCRPTS